MNFYQTCFSFFIYGILGWCAEVAFAAVKQRKFVNRGFLNGPICPIYGLGIIAVVQILMDYKDNLILLYGMSVVVATLLEWLTGMLLEKLFHHRWWDYTNMPLNIQRHICLPFSLAWGVACVIVVRFVHPPILKVIGWFPLIVGKIILFILFAVMVTDLCVTVNGILKMNLKLKKMQEITDELQKLSVHIGKNISKNVLQSIERQELLKRRVEETKAKYQEHFESMSFTHRRLLDAFPKMQSLHYKKQLMELKEFLQKKKTGGK